MKNRWSLIVAVVVLICSVAWVGKAQLNRSDKTTWEYQTVFVHHTQSPDLNRLGADGWELAGLSCAEGNPCVWVFKRSK